MCSLVFLSEASPSTSTIENDTISTVENSSRRLTKTRSRLPKTTNAVSKAFTWRMSLLSRTARESSPQLKDRRPPWTQWVWVNLSSNRPIIKWGLLTLTCTNRGHKMLSLATTIIRLEASPPNFPDTRRNLGWYRQKTLHIISLLGGACLHYLQ